MAKHIKETNEDIINPHSPDHQIELHFAFIVLLVIVLQGCAGNSHLVSYEVSGAQTQALLSEPEGPGPFPTVVYNHGRIVDEIGYTEASFRGYDIKGICEALAADGFLVFAPIRKSGPGNIFRHKEEVDRAIDYVKNLPEVDPARIALMGFSRGGLLTLMVAVERRDLSAYLILAPAPGRGHFADAAQHISSLSAPVLLLVEASDDNKILEDFEMLSQALKEKGKASQIILYNRGGGHRLFWDVGYYWDDVRRFLQDNLASPSPGLKKPIASGKRK